MRHVLRLCGGTPVPPSDLTATTETYRPSGRIHLERSLKSWGILFACAVAAGFLAARQHRRVRQFPVHYIRTIRTGGVRPGLAGHSLRGVPQSSSSRARGPRCGIGRVPWQLPRRSGQEMGRGLGGTGSSTGLHPLSSRHRPDPKGRLRLQSGRGLASAGNHPFKPSDSARPLDLGALRIRRSVPCLPSHAGRPVRGTPAVR